jgi:hypothetical protein
VHAESHHRHQRATPGGEADRARQLLFGLVFLVIAERLRDGQPLLDQVHPTG